MVAGHKRVLDVKEQHAAASEKARNKSLPTVQDYLSAQLDLCGRPQRQVAADAGFKSPQMLNMVKNGNAKLPMDRVEPLAEVLGVDPARFIQIWFNDYHPAEYAMIQRAMGFATTENERDILTHIREVSGETNPRCDEGVKMDLSAAFAKFKDM